MFEPWLKILVLCLSVERYPRSLAVNIKDALSTPGGRIRVILDRPQPPVHIPGKWVLRYAPQETKRCVDPVRRCDPLDQYLQGLRITFIVRRVTVERADLTAVTGNLESIDRPPNLPQVASKFDLPLALYQIPGHRDGACGEHCDDCEHDDQFTEREPALISRSHAVLRPLRLKTNGGSDVESLTSITFLPLLFLIVRSTSHRSRTADDDLRRLTVRLCAAVAGQSQPGRAVDERNLGLSFGNRLEFD